MSAQDVAERREIEAALRESEERFRLIAENASDMIGLFDLTARRVYVNPAYERLFGARHQLVGRQPFADMHVDDRERMQQHFQEMVSTGLARSAEFRLVLPDGGVRHIESHSNVIRDKNGRVGMVVTVSRDVTERRLTEEALRARELQLQDAQAVANLGSWEWDVVSGRITWSEQLYRICGVTPGAFQPSLEAFLALVHPEDRARCTADAQRSQETADQYDDCVRIVRPDGAVRTIRARSHADADQTGRPVRIVGICHDVTEQKAVEEELRSYAERLLVTYRRLVGIQETERSQLARELHDRVGPNLTALGINLRLIADALPAEAQGRIAGMLKDSTRLVQDTIAGTRDIMGELRPLGLDEYGLLGALRAFVATFSQRTGIRVSIESTEAAARAARPGDLTMFRIAQEALNNVAKHARAESVRVRYAEKPEGASLEIEDDGVGFDFAARDAGAGWGLLIMRERAAAAGMRFELDSDPGRGVLVRVSMPS